MLDIMTEAVEGTFYDFTESFCLIDPGQCEAGVIIYKDHQSCPFEKASNQIGLSTSGVTCGQLISLEPVLQTLATI